MMTVVKPSGTPAVAKSTSKLMPSRISGITMGSATSVWMSRDAGKRWRWSSQAPPVPITMESTVVASATTRLFQAACLRGAFTASWRYQSSVKPCQDTLRREALKEYTTSTAIGRYRNANTAKVHARSPRSTTTVPEVGRLFRRGGGGMMLLSISCAQLGMVRKGALAKSRRRDREPFNRPEP